MDQLHWDEINRIVDAALDLNQKEQKTYIEKQCKGDKELKKQVVDLLRNIEASQATSFLDLSKAYPQHLAANLLEEHDQKIQCSSLSGEVVGSYKILDLIDHGGMGSVYLAERADEAYDQYVAFKVIRRGMDTPSNIARFKRERQILANLDHHNIAKLLDGGITGEGLPYLVMEFVEGKPLIEFCDQEQLNLNQRLSLFGSICETVQHAHNNAVIHRDLKPSNILVSPDSKIKILDFGIAKMLETKGLEQNQYQTHPGSRLLTIGYAAPEQIEHKTITTATDTYALGTLLYELVTGVHPFNRDDKKLSEMEQLIRKKTPDCPSDRFMNLPSEDQKQIAILRNMTASSLYQELQGDLDAIVMKALRKEPVARYSSTEQLVEDLKRREKNLPVIARSDTFRYKTGKFIKRNKTALSVAAGVMMLLAAFLIFHTMQITEERYRAELEAQKAQKSLEYLVGVFQHADPYQTGSQEITATQILEDGTDFINDEIQDAEIKASLSNALGTIYQNLGKYDKAKPLLYEALKHNKNRSSADDPDLAASMRDWAGYNMKTANYDTAKKYFQKSAVIFQENGYKDEYASVTGELGWINYREGNYEDADSLINEALKMNLSIHGLESKEAAMDLQYLGWVKNAQGDYSSAEKLFQKSLSIRETVLGTEHRLVAQTLQSLGRVLYNKGEYEKAKEKEKEALSIQKSIFDGDHPEIATTLNIIGLIQMRQEEYENAESHLGEALEMRLKFYGENNPDVLKSRNDLATIYYFNREYVKAAKLFRKVAELNKQLRGSSHPELATSLNNLAKSLQKAGQKEQALKHYMRSIQIGRSNYPADHPKLIQFRRNTAILYEELNHYEEASKLWQENLLAIREREGSINKETENILTHLIHCQQQLGNTEQASRYQAFLTGSAK